MECPGCGGAVSRPDQRFCAKCGTRLAPAVPPTVYGQAPRITGPLFADDVPPPPPPQAAPPTYAVPVPPPPPPPGYAVAPPPSSYDDHGSRRRGPIVLLAVAALVAALIGAGGAVLLFADDGDDTTAEDRRRDGSATSTDAGPTAPTSPTDPDRPDGTSEPAAFRCWNGGPSVTRLAACTPPFGAAGMAWVFPSSTGPTCSTESGARRASEAECAPAVGADTVRFHYSEWRSRTALESYYGGNTVTSIGAPNGRDDLTAVQVVSRDSAVGYKVAIYYADPTALWSVTVYAADEPQYRDALDQLQMRPFRQLRGEGV